MKSSPLCCVPTGRTTAHPLHTIGNYGMNGPTSMVSPQMNRMGSGRRRDTSSVPALDVTPKIGMPHFIDIYPPSLYLSCHAI
jgi:hypothetical protein